MKQIKNNENKKNSVIKMLIAANIWLFKKIIGRNRKCKICGKENNNRFMKCKYCGDKKDRNKSIVIVVVLIFIAGIVNISKLDNELSYDNNSNNIQTQNKLNDNNNNIQTLSQTEINIKETLLKLNIEENDIDMLKLKKTNDWTAGERYTYLYKNMTLYIYMQGDNTVDSINLHVSELPLYKSGFEPISIDNYIVDISIYSELQSLLETQVKNKLNYPNTSNFSFLDWGVARYNNIYCLSSSVKAKNGFGVESELKFYGEYEVTNGNYKIIYLVIDGDIKIGNNSKKIIPDLKEVEDVSKDINTNEFTLIDGLKGEYGVDKKLDDYNYIWYYIPEGKYEITSVSKNSGVYIDKDEYIRNQEGYVEIDNIKTIRFTSSDTSQIIEIKAGEHISLIVNSKVKFTKIE